MCAQQLCEASTEMAGALVRGDIHLLLFGMLYHVEQERVDGVSILADSGGEEGEDGAGVRKTFKLKLNTQERTMVMGDDSLHISS